jgi:nitrite reductase/ring-hydroxylating ferredoxin subunit
MAMSTDVIRDLTHAMDRLGAEPNTTLDGWADQIQQFQHSLIEQGGPAARRVKNWLNGTWLGHSLHPALTDVPIGAWSTGSVLDLVGARDAADAAYTVGVLAAVPTALSGAADWSDTEGEARRTGLVHALLNSVGLVLMVGSLVARRNNQRGLGILLSTGGLTAATLAAWLGGRLVLVLGTGVGRNVFEPSVDEFQAVASADAVPEGKLSAAQANVNGTAVPLVLYRRGPTILAIDGTCTHWGDSLAGGKVVEDDCVECPWHGSRFSLIDGEARQGPAAVAVHVYETRIREGKVEVRRR